MNYQLQMNLLIILFISYKDDKLYNLIITNNNYNSSTVVYYLYLYIYTLCYIYGLYYLRLYLRSVISLDYIT